MLLLSKAFGGEEVIDNTRLFSELVVNINAKKKYRDEIMMSISMEKVKYEQQAFEEALFIDNEMKKIHSYKEEYLLINSVAKYFYKKILKQVNFKNIEIELQTENGLRTYFNTEIRALLIKLHVFDFNYRKQKDGINTIDQYNNLILNEGVGKFFEQYPGIVYPLYNFFYKTKKFLEKLVVDLAADWNQLSKINILHSKKVTDMLFNLGDTHNDGKQVVILVFGKEKVLYKPRSSSNDVIYQKLIQKWNEDNKESQLKVPKILTSPTHCWVEYIPNLPLKTIEQVENFYNKMGIQAAFVYVLNGSDFHKENIIAFGDSPVFIDMECLFSRGCLSSQKGKLEESIIATHLFPLLQLPIGQIGRTISGIVPFDSFSNTYEQSVVIYNSEGFLEITTERKTQTVDKNVPFDYTQHYFASRYSESILEGFKAGYEYLSSIKKEILSIVSNIKNESRLILRATREYSKLLSLSYHPRLLMNKNDREMYLLTVFEKSYNTAILFQEYKSLINGDIPFTSICFDERALIINDKKISDPILEETPKQLLEKRLATLSTEDLSKQLDFIKAAIDPHENLLSRKLNLKRDSNIDFLKKVQQIVLAIEKNNEFKISRKEREIQLTEIDDFIYNGRAGLYLVYIQLYKITSKECYLKKVKNFLQGIASKIEKLKNLEDIGFFTGYSGLIHLSLIFYKETKDLSVLSLAITIKNKLLSFIEENNEVEIDILSGLAGFLSVLIDLYRLTSRVVLKENCTDITKRIIKNAYSDDSDTGIWWTRKLTGFSHGNSGIIYALNKYNKYINEISVDKYINSALLFERNFKNNNGWKDLRNNEINEDTNTWCNGSPGILITRYELMKDLEEKVLEDYLLAYSNVEFNSDGLDYNLCHGLLGNFLILFVVSENEEEKQYFKNLILKHCEGIFSASNLKNNIINYSLDLGLLTGLLGAVYAYLFVLNHSNHSDLILFLN